MGAIGLAYGTPVLVTVGQVAQVRLYYQRSLYYRSAGLMVQMYYVTVQDWHKYKCTIKNDFHFQKKSP